MSAASSDQPAAAAATTTTTDKASSTAATEPIPVTPGAEAAATSTAGPAAAAAKPGSSDTAPAAAASAAPAPQSKAAPWSKTKPKEPAGETVSEVVVESWPSLGDVAKKADKEKDKEKGRPVSASRKEGEPKGRGKWVPFPEPVPVAPREEISPSGDRDHHSGRRPGRHHSSDSDQGEHRREGSHIDHRTGGDASRRGRRGGGRGGSTASGPGGRGSSFGPRRGGHHSANRSNGAPSGSAASASESEGTYANQDEQPTERPPRRFDRSRGDASSGYYGQQPAYGQDSYYGAGAYGDAYPPYGYPPYGFDAQFLAQAVQNQIEYYFSDENLAKDKFMREVLETEGSIAVERIASFRRLANMIAMMPYPQNCSFILSAVRGSKLVDVVDHNRLRRHVKPALNRDAPVFVPSRLTADAPEFVPSGAAAAVPSADSPAAAAAAAAEATAAPSTAPAPAASAAPAAATSAAAPAPVEPRRNLAAPGSPAALRARAGSNPRSPALARAKGKIHTSRKQAAEDDDEMDFMFDEEVSVRPGSKAPLKHSSGPQSRDHSDDEEDEEEIPEEEFENIVVLVQPNPRDKKFEPRDRTGLPQMKAKAEFTSHINDELKDFSEGVEHKSRTGSFSKTAVVSRAEFEAQRALSGMSPSQLLQQPAPSLPTMPGQSLSPKSQPMSIARSPMSTSMARSPGTIPSSEAAQKKFFPTPVKEPAPSKKTPYKSKYGSNPVAEAGVGWIQVRNARASPASILASSVESNGVPKARQLATDLLSPQGLIEQKYRKFVNECLADRETRGPGKSELMSALFRFWSFFLRNNFNRSVYEEFKKLARDDVAAGFSYGMECLYRFYSYGLEKTFRRGPFEDFQLFVLEDFKSNNLYGLEKFWAFLQYRKDKRPVKILPELEATLANFKTLDDFHAYGSSANNTSSGSTSAAAAAAPAAAADS